jgi:hypothetical protein
VAPRVGLDAKKRNISCPCRVWNLGSPIRSPVAIPTENGVKSRISSVRCFTVERTGEVNLGCALCL